MTAAPRSSRVLPNATARSSDEVRLALRLCAVGVVAVLLQNTFFAQARLFSGNVDILPLVALAAGFLAGPNGGAATGFGMGVLSDLLLGTPLGLSSLMLLIIGELGGRVGSARDPEGLFVPMLTGAVVTFGALVFGSIAHLMLGAQAGASWDLLRLIVVTSLLNGLIAPLVYRATRRGVVGALAKDPRARRRRATTTRLSPLSSSRGQNRQRSSSVSGGRLPSRGLTGGNRRRGRGRGRARR